MKRTLMITALVSSTALAAQAATDLQREEVQQFLPGVDVSTLSDAQVDSLVGAMHGGGSRSERAAAMRSLVGDGNPVMTEGTAFGSNDLQSYAPEIDFSRFSDAELAQARSIINGASSRSDAIAQLRSFELRDRVITTDPLTGAEMQEIRGYAPDIDLSALSDEQILRIQAAISGGDRSEIRAVIDSITES